MLVEFSASNFRSIKTRQTLSMVAGASAARRHQHSMESGNSFAPHLLRSACILGANGAGKTSLVRAMSFFVGFVTRSAKETTSGESINVHPYRADPESAEKPSEFEVVFVANGSLYQYGFAATRDRVLSEWMFVRPNAAGTRTRQVFQREYDDTIEDYAWAFNGSVLKGDREVWRRSTRTNALFLSTATQLNAEGLKDAFTWIDRYFRIIPSPERLHLSMTASAALDDRKKDQILSLFNAMDLPIVDFKVEERDLDVPAELQRAFTAEFLEVMRSVAKEERQFKVTTYHDSGNLPAVAYDLSEESDGTQVAFALAGPLLETQEFGFTIVVDELHNSLHPLMLKFIVGMFYDPDINSSGAQIIFTSHDTSVISQGFMHRDQIWLLKRSEADGTTLTPLSDFSVREVQSFQRAYLGGKFGSIPNLRRWRGGKEQPTISEAEGGDS